MTTAKSLVLLAKSHMNHALCVAGVELVNGVPEGWIRPVSRRQGLSVRHSEMKYENGEAPNLLDIVEVPLAEHHPEDHQKENWLFDDKKFWNKIGEFPWQELKKIAVQTGPLWGNRRHNANDRIPAHMADQETDSLRLIQVRNMKLRVSGPRVRGIFQFDDEEYSLWVKDENIEGNPKYANDGDEFKIEDCFLAISLGRSFKGNCYKLIAGVLAKPQ